MFGNFVKLYLCQKVINHEIMSFANKLLFYFSSCLVAHEASTRSFHAPLSRATLRAVSHVSDAQHSSSSIVRLQVVLGLPFFLFPSGVHVSAVFAGISGFILITCPSHLHLLFLMILSILSWLVFCRSLLFDILSGQNTVIILRRLVGCRSISHSK